ncbi:uncharacterized protein Foxo1l isoform X2 [Rattus norvegicus]|uniref:uncharacterized protein Foxo1l isoform X2 n=1 Tax=Rattus norvegicus TaxID=10116 RepID=UPI001916F9E2|nr:uncharacterized protein LOC102551518 isoform X3 [Rattus norvegicus]
MGQTQTTPLSVFLEHFKDYKIRARSRGFVVKKKRLAAFCRKEWPTFNVGWPPEGTYYLPEIFRTRDIIIFGRPGRPAQIAYISTWLDLVQDPPKWLKPWLPKQPSIAILSLENPEPQETETNPRNPLYPVLQGGTEEDLNPEPRETETNPRNPLYPVLQGGTEEDLNPEPRETETNPRNPLYPVLQGGTEEDLLLSHPPYRPPLGGLPGPQPEAPGGAQGPPLAIPPRIQEKAQQQLPQPPTAESMIHPLRAIGPQDDERNQLAVRELYNWKMKYPRFSEKPAALISLIDSVILTHQPTWDECQLLLKIFFTREEQERILIEAIKLVPGANESPIPKQVLFDAGFDSTRPDWNFNSAEGKESLRVYHQTLMRGLRAAGQGPTHLAKVRSVHQEWKEPPEAYLERIKEAYRTYTSLNPEAPENKSAVITTFVNQAACDIRDTLQRLDRVEEKSLQELLVIAKKAIDNREILKKKQLQTYEEPRNRGLAMTLMADSPEEKRRQRHQLEDGKGKRPQPKDKPALRKNQCAYCRKMGHWVRDCPKKPTKRDKGGQGSDPLPEPRVTLKVERKPSSFSVDTGAQYSVQTQSHGKLSSKKSWKQGATGMNQYAQTTQRTVDLGSGQVSCSFNCPNPRLLTEIGTQNSFDQKGNSVTDHRGCPGHKITLPLDDEYKLHQRPSSLPNEISTWLTKFPSAWAETGGMGLADHRTPICVELIPGATPVQMTSWWQQRPWKNVYGVLKTC